MSRASSETEAARELERLQALCEAIAHPARRQILLTLHLRGGESTAGDIARRFAHAWPTTTRHLRVLEHAGLLAMRAVGRERLYRLADDAFAPLSTWLAWFGVESLYQNKKPASTRARAASATTKARPGRRSRA